MGEGKLEVAAAAPQGCGWPARPPTIACAILAGGRGSRYGGVAKGTLALPTGATIVGRLLAEVAAAGITDVLIVANEDEPYRRCGCSVMKDRRPGLGPLGGVETALWHFAGVSDAVLILPCDLPGITAREIAALRAAYCADGARLVAARTKDCVWHPLCAIIHTGLRARISAALDGGQHSVWRLWEDLGVVPVSFPDCGPFFNVNCPADMAAWVARADGRGKPSGCR